MVHFMTAVVKLILAYIVGSTLDHTPKILLCTYCKTTTINRARKIVLEKYIICVCSMLFCGYERSKNL